MTRLHLVRGLPGSGKSTFAKRLMTTQGITKHFEADMYFCRNGEYEFDSLLLFNAHRWCYESTFNALEEGFDVVVSNTFVTKKDIQEYLDLGNVLGVEIWIYTMTESFGSVHGVPEKTLEKMKRRWVAIPGENLISSTERHTKLIASYNNHPQGELA